MVGVWLRKGMVRVWNFMANKVVASWVAGLLISQSRLHGPGLLYVATPVDAWKQKEYPYRRAKLMLNDVYIHP